RARGPRESRSMSSPLSTMLAALLLASRAGAVTPALPVHVSPVQTDSLRAACAADRADQEKTLRESPTSYLAAVARTDFGARPSLVVGRAADCDLRVDDPELASHHLRVSVAGDSFRVEALDDTANVLVGGTPTRQAIVPPSYVRVGRFTIRLSHQRFPAL